jgi:hypothetical protein
MRAAINVVLTRTGLCIVAQSDRELSLGRSTTLLYPNSNTETISLILSSFLPSSFLPNRTVPVHRRSFGQGHKADEKAMCIVARSGEDTKPMGKPMRAAINVVLTRTGLCIVAQSDRELSLGRSTTE